ncbi:hypothetical protein [Streptomyces flavofungini]|uniref:hypothetical protein n=1 Tax=Streptomyces flavofungini TaxID=68200 RepID=UPI0025B11D28|nr:hypothetical protein [Streptomyces flavofungini]WJV51808.1 hypothetical protein QUY26_39990 [Streptomyces flavofungini]
MPDTFSTGPLRRWAVTLTVVLAAVTVVSAVLLLPHLLLPRIGDAFTSPPAHRSAPPRPADGSDACQLVAGPAKSFCQRGEQDTEVAPTPGDRAGVSVTSAILLAPAVLGVAVILASRRSTS